MPRDGGMFDLEKMLQFLFFLNPSSVIALSSFIKLGCSSLQEGKVIKKCNLYMEGEGEVN